MNNSIIRTAALELQAADNTQVVKVAGVLRRLKNWLKGLADPEFRSSVKNMRDKSEATKYTLSELSIHIDNLLQAIKDGQVSEFDTELDTVRLLATQIAKNVDDLRGAAEEVKIISKEMEHYNEDEFNDPIKKQKIYENLRKALPSTHDVDIGKYAPGTGKPFKSYKWFEDITIEDIDFSQRVEGKAQTNTKAAIANIIKRTTHLSDEEISQAVENNWSDFKYRLKQGILNNSIVEEYDLPKPTLLHTESGKLRRILGEMDVTVIINDIEFLPGLVGSLQVTLLSLKARINSPLRKMVISLVKFLSVKSNGMPIEKIRNQRKELTEEEKKARREQHMRDIAARTRANSPPTTTPVDNDEQVEEDESSADDGFNNDTILAVNGIEKTSPAFRKRLVEVAKNVGTNPDWLAALISNETAGEFKASTVNKGNPEHGAVGLIQFMPETCAILFGHNKHTMSAIEWQKVCDESRKKMMNMNDVAQLDYVEKFLNWHKGKLNSPEDLYMATFWPKGVGKPSDYVIAHAGSKVYEQNKLFDPEVVNPETKEKSRSGVITKNNVGASIRSKINSTEKRISVNSNSLNEEFASNNPNDFANEAEKLYNSLNAMGPIEKIVKQAILKTKLPTSKVIVSISGINLENKIKFANSMTNVLKEIIDVNSSVNVNGNNVELDCYGVGTPINLTNAIQALCDCAVIKTASNIICKSIPDKDYNYDI